MRNCTGVPNNPLGECCCSLAGLFREVLNQLQKGSQDVLKNYLK